MSTKVKKILTISIASVCLLGFVLLLILVASKYNFKIDRLGEWFFARRNKFFTGFFKYFTYLGSVYFFAFLALLLLAFTKNKRVGLIAILNLIASSACVVVVKFIIRRDRPIYMAVSETGFSFPSAHALISIAFYGLMIFLVLKYLKHKPLKIILTILLSVVIILLGLSRIYLGVHYTSDVFAGFLLGGLILAVNILLYDWMFNFKFKKQNQSNDNN